MMKGGWRGSFSRRLYFSHGRVSALLVAASDAGVLPKGSGKSNPSLSPARACASEQMSSIGEQFGVRGRRKMLRADVPGRAQAIRMWTLTSKPDSTIERLEKGYLDALSSVDLAENIGKQLHADTRYTDQGRQDQYRDHILHQAVPVFRQGRRAISRAKQELDRMRTRLQLPKADPADAAGAIAKMELRTWLRGLPQVERDKITRAENLDPQVRAAIIEAALALTGVADSHLAVLKEGFARSAWLADR
ncbi:hypothetical protein ACVJF2_000946 [Bradyrhizobium sp. USDA 4519]